MNRIAKSLVPAVLAGAIALAATAAPGDLDPSFGTAGETRVSFGKSEKQPGGLVVQADGKFILGVNLIGFESSKSALMRFNADRTLDATWGVQGQASQGSLLGALAMSGGQAIAAIDAGFPGSSNAIGQYHAFELARYTTAGALDTSFGTGGFTLDFDATGATATTGEQGANAIGVAAGGKLLVAGFVNAQGAYNHVLVARFNANGTLDNTFGPGGTGWITFPIGSATTSVVAHAVAVEADGRIVVAGTQASGPAQAGFVARVLADGSGLDTTFASVGYAFTGPGSPGNSDCRSVALVGARIVVGCKYNGSGSNLDFFVAAYTSGGIADATFTPTVIDAGDTNDQFGGFAVHADGRIFVIGTRGATSPRLVIAAVGANGALDTSFNGTGLYVMPEADTTQGTAIAFSGSALLTAGTRGVQAEETIVATFTTAGARTALSGYGNPSSAMSYLRPAIAAGGKIVVGSMAGEFATPYMVINRFTPSGALDATFGVGGFSKLVIPNSAENIGVREVAVQADGKVLGVSEFGSFTTNAARVGVARLDAAGGGDPAFNAAGTPGYNYVQLGTGGVFTRGVRIQSDGKILAQGNLFPGTTRQIAVVRFNSDGAVDTSYGTNGVATTNFPNNNNGRHMALDAAGRAVVVGNTGASATIVRFARFTTSGALDGTFGSGGMIAHSLPAGYTTRLPTNVIALPSGKILATLNLRGATQDYWGVMRLNSDGTLDPTYGSAGFVTITDVDWALDRLANPWDAALTPNGKLVIAGLASTATNPQRSAVARLNPNGSRDASFGVSGLRYYPVAGGDLTIAGVDVFSDGALALTGSLTAGAEKLGWVTKTVADPTAVAPLQLASNDFNADGKPDILWSNTSSGATYVWYMNGPLFLSDAFVASIDPSWKVQGVADFNGDGHPDLIWRNTASGATYVWYMNGPSFVSDAFLFSLPPQWVIQGVADFNADGHPDFLMRNTDPASGVGFVWFFNDATPIGDQFLFGIDPVWKVEQVGDLNADRQPDLLFRNMSSGLAFAWYTRYIDGQLQLTDSSPPIFSIDPVWEVAQLDDWNGDGNPDLLFRNANSGLVFVWYMTGTTLGGSDYVTQIDPSWEIVPRR